MPPYGPSSALWGTHAKQGNPSRIRAQGLCHSSVYGRRKRLFETAKNHSKPLKTIEGPCQSMPPYMVPPALCGARVRNKETPAGSEPKGYAIRPYTGDAVEGPKHARAKSSQRCPSATDAKRGYIEETTKQSLDAR